jgi:hypothetical protein
MSAAGTAPIATIPWEQYQKLPPIARSRPLTDEEYSRLSPEQLQTAGLAEPSESAPADFGGRVLPNPTHIRPQLDTDPTTPITRLPQGIAFHHENWSGTPQMDVSNPAAADVQPELGREVGAQFGAKPSAQPGAPANHGAFSWSDEQDASSPSSSPSPASSPAKAQGSPAFAWSDEEEKPKAEPTPGNAPGTITGDTATISATPGKPVERSAAEQYARGYAPAGAFRRYSGGFLDRATSTFGEDLNHPSNFIPSWHSLLGIPGMAYDAGKEAVSEWQHRNEAPGDPAEAVGHLGVPLLGAIVTHSADALGNPVEAAPLRPEPAWKTAPSAGTEIPSILNRQPYAREAMPRIASPAAEVAPEITPRELPRSLDATGENKPFAGGPDEPRPARILDATGENRPFAGGMDEPRAALPRIAKPPGSAGSIAESVLGSGDPILDRLRANAARIEQEGHGNAFREESEPTPRTTNLNEDLTPALEASLRKVNAAKARIAPPPAEAGVPKTVYDRLIGEAMQEGPAWTPEKAKPIVSALNKNPGVEFEARGSVGEGRSTSNDLDLFQKKGSPADAADTLKGLGFKRVASTAHGETWTNGAQHIDIWDSEHEPIKGYSGALVTK